MNYYDNYDFITNFASDSLAYRDMTGYDSKYTGLISAQSANGNLTCREDGLAWYDFSDRMYDPMLPQFNGVDALSEKKPWNSPYAYCGGNPILRVDPTGFDEWDINSKGYIVNHKKTKAHDAFYMVDENNKRVNGKELVFNYGKVTHRSLKSKILKKTYNLDIFEIKGDKYGTKLFEFMSDNITNTSYVEYSIVRTGSKTKGTNYISTGHEAGKEPALTHLISKELYKQNIVVREIGHGHPLTQGADKGDIRFSKQANIIFKNSNRKIPKYFIYYLPLQQYIYFKSNSKPINK